MPALAPPGDAPLDTLSGTSFDLGLEANGLGIVLQGLIVAIEIG